MLNFFRTSVTEKHFQLKRRREEKHSRGAECLGVTVLTLADSRMIQWIKLTKTSNYWSLPWAWVPSGAGCGWTGGARRRGNTQTPEHMFTCLITQTLSLNLFQEGQRQNKLKKGQPMPWVGSRLQGRAETQQHHTCSMPFSDTTSSAQSVFH